MVTFLVSTCLELSPALLSTVSYEYQQRLKIIRIHQYLEFIHYILELANQVNGRVILIENNGKRETPLDSLGCEVLYTNNNSLSTANKGIKEIQDIWDCIQHYNIPDDELIVKVTGRYRIDLNGQFCNVLRSCNPETTDAILRYGWYGDTSKETPHEDCLTGLIAMKCKYIKAIQFEYDEKTCIEHDWGKTSLTIDPKRVHVLTGLIGYRMYMWNTDDYTDL